MKRTGETIRINSSDGAQYNQSPAARENHMCSGNMLCFAIACSSCLIPAFLFTFLIAFFAFLLSGNLNLTNATLAQCEQVVVCPKTFLGDNISFISKGVGVVASLVDPLPPISNDTNLTVDTFHDVVLTSKKHQSWVFHLINGSTIYWRIESESPFQFCVMKDELYFDFDDRNFHNDCLVRSYSNFTNKSFTATEDTHYFIILRSIEDRMLVSKLVFSVEHTRHVVEGHRTDTCTTSCNFTVNSSKIPGTCLIAELPCGGHSSEVDISYREEHSTAYEVSLAITIVSVVLLTLCIVGCVSCMVLKNTRSNKGHTYQRIGDSSYPTGGYQASYQTTPSSESSSTSSSASSNKDSTSTPYVPFDPVYGTLG